MLDRTRRTLAVSLLLLLGALAPVVAAEPPVQVTWSDGDRVIYPRLNPDDQTYLLAHRQTRDANLTVVVKNSAGTVVRTFYDRVSRRADGSGTPLRWDLADESRRAVPDGVYTFEMTAVDSGGNIAQASTQAGIDRRTRPMLGGVTDGATVSGTIRPTFVPPADLDVTEASFTATPVGSTDPRACAVAPLAPPTAGTFSGALDLTGCPGGPLRVEGWFRLTDPLGGRATGYTAAPTVTTTDRTPPVIAPMGTYRQSLASSTAYDTVEWGILVSDPSRVARAAFWVTDSAGRTVRGEQPITVTGDRTTELTGAFRWNGRNDSGVLQPGGTYRTHARVVDRAGNTATATGSVILDARVPGTLKVTPIAGAPNQYRFTVTVPNGVSIWDIKTYPWGGLAHQQPGTQTWTQVIDVTPGGAGPFDLSAQITWQYPDGRPGGTFITPPVRVTVTDTSAPIVKTPAPRRVYLEQAGTYQWSEFRYEVIDPSGLASCRYWITDQAGRTVVAERGFDSCSPAAIHWKGRNDAGALQPSGTYTIRTRFTDTQGHATIGDPTTLTLDATIPGSVTATPDPADPDLFHVTVTPAAGVTVVSVVVPHTDTVTRDPATGRWHAAVDLSRRADVTEIDAGVRWQVPGGDVGFRTASTPLRRVDTKPPVVTTYGPALLQVTSPTSYDGGTIGYGIEESYGLASASYRITSADGTVVVPQRAFETLPEGSGTVWWDGTTPDGSLAPAGTYTVHARFTDRAGHVTDAAPGTMRLERTVPGDLTGPFENGPLSGTVYFEYTPNRDPRVKIQSASVVFAGGAGGPGFYNPSVDGIWRSTFNVDKLRSGTNSYVVWTTWVDPQGAHHLYKSAPATLEVAPHPDPEPEPELPGAPDVTVTPGNRTVRVTWSAPSGAVSGYRLEWAGPGQTWTGTELSETARTHRISSLSNGTRYRIRVQALTGGEPGVWSAVLTAMPDATAPAPTRLTARAVRRGAVLRWHPGVVTADHGRPTSYAVQVRVRGTTRWRTFRVTNPQTTSVRVTGLRPRTGYELRVVARNAVGTTASGPVRVRVRR